MQQRFGSADVGSLPCQSRGQANRQLLRQIHRVELEIGQRGLAWESARENGELVTRLGEIALQRR